DDRPPARAGCLHLGGMGGGAVARGASPGPRRRWRGLLRLLGGGAVHAAFRAGCCERGGTGRAFGSLGPRGRGDAARQAHPARKRARIEHFRFSSNRENALSFCFYAISNAKPLRTFAGIALGTIRDE